MLYSDLEFSPWDKFVMDEKLFIIFFCVSFVPFILVILRFKRTIIQDIVERNLKTEITTRGDNFVSKPLLIYLLISVF